MSIMLKRYCFTFFFILFFTGVSFAQDKSNRGKEFWLAYGFDYSFFNESPVNNQELALYISTELAATVTVSVTNTGFTQTLNIPANTVDATILIPKSGANDARTLTDGLQNRGIHVVSDVPVAVYAHVYSTMVSGATMLMPVETYGYLYHSVNYSQATSGSQLPNISPTSQNGPDWYSWFYAIASEDNTRINITPSDTTKNGWLPGQTYTVNLNKGESYHVFGKMVAGNNAAYAASKDMTGSKVLSVAGGDGACHPVAVFSGSGGIRLCRGDGGEFMHQQVFPAQAWGTRYLTYHTINNTNTDILETNRNYYRICVADPTTVVKKNGVVMTGLVNNFYYEHMDSTGGDYFEADKPILVAQYTPNKNQCWNFPVTTPAPPSYGDPEMFYISPVEQGQKSVLFYTSRKSGIDYVYANIFVPTAAVSSLKVDGNTLPATQVIPHPNNPAYSVALARFIGPAAQHTITCDSALNATVYGLGNYESYGYNAGTLINNLNIYGGVKNSFGTSNTIDTITCRNTPVRLFVKLAFPATSIHWKLSQVPGITPNTDSIVNNPALVGTELINGRTYYIYTLQQDFIFSTVNANTIIPISYSSLVIANCFQTENASIKISVKDGPKSDFTFTNAGCLTDTVSFTGSYTSNGFNITQYLWNFPDNTTASTITAKKRFTTTGIQNVRFRAIADNGCAGDTVKPVTILPSPVCKVGVTTPTCDSVFVSDTSSISSGSIKSYTYYWGDGTFTTTNAPNPFYHVYTVPGTYIVKHITVSNNNCVSDTAYSIPVVVAAKPRAKFGFDKNICLGDSIKFTDSSTITSGSIVSWQWNFGDNTPVITYNTNTAFFYKYAATGIYTVTLQATSSNGCINVYSLQVSVNNKPAATITAIGKPCTDSSFLFTSSLSFNSNNPAIWYWNFGDGQTSSILNSNTATYAYNSALNNITVKHVAGYGPGCMSDTAFYTIPLINPNPAAVLFNVSALSACALKPVQFTAAPPPGIVQWLWNFGDGNGNQVPPFSKVYSAAANYTPSLKVVSAAGCGSALSSQNIIVLPAPVVNAGTDKTISTGSSVNMTANIIPAAGNYNYLWSPSTGLSSTVILNPAASPAATTTYALTVTDNTNGCTSTDSVKVSVISKLYIPNTFTPNNDGKNDRWNIAALVLYPEAVVSIFNRYGEKIFETNNYALNAWDGTYKGKNQPMGSYIYIIQFAPGKIEKGLVTIVR
jgi:gliding motility-associated-like protein